jgi:hypothetical protein
MWSFSACLSSTDWGDNGAVIRLTVQLLFEKTFPYVRWLFIYSKSTWMITNFTLIVSKILTSVSSALANFSIPCWAFCSESLLQLFFYGWKHSLLFLWVKFSHLNFIVLLYISFASRRIFKEFKKVCLL